VQPWACVEENPNAPRASGIILPMSELDFETADRLQIGLAHRGFAFQIRNSPSASHPTFRGLAFED
jgi:hypothetical protein